jgi:arylsulfatase A-like enzyme
MRHLIRLLSGILVCFLLAAALPAAAQTPARDRTVVVISLDGFPAFSLDDPKLPVPTLRRLASQGATARRMTTVNPSVTWPSHTSIVTGVLPGQHGLFYNGTFVCSQTGPGGKVEPWIEKEKMVHIETIYDAAHHAGLTTAQVDWVAIHKAQTITWAFPEVPSIDGPIEREMIARGLVTRDEVEQFRPTNIFRRDEIWTDAAIHILREHKPNLLLFHLLSLDSTHHTYGPRTLAGLAAMAFLDGCVARVLDAIDTAGLAPRTTVIVVSDHGFKAFKNQIQPNAALASAGLGRDVQGIAEGGTAMVYLDKAKAAGLAPKVRPLLAALEGVASVAGPAEFPALGLPDPAREPQMPGLILIAKDGYAFAGASSGPALTPIPETRGSHGYPASDPDMDAIFIAAGPAIRPGARLDRIPNLDVAPTIAAILGLRLPAAAGRPLTEILR